MTGTPTPALTSRPARGAAQRRAELDLLRTDPEAYFALPLTGTRKADEDR